MHARSLLLVAVALVAGTVGFTGSSAADVSSVGGGAFGASVDVALSGGPPTTVEPVPSVALPSSGDRVTDSVPSLSVTSEDPTAPFGGTLLQTATLMADSHGTTGPAGSSTSAATVGDVDAFNSFLTATEVASTCTSSESGSVASTTLTDASRVGNETERLALPTQPEPNTIVHSTVPGSDDVVTVMLNEQQVVDGSMVVNAVRIVVDGPSAVGEVVLAQSRCVVVVTAPTPPAPGERSAEPVADPAEPADEPVIEPVDEPEAQLFALPSDDLPAETLAASVTGTPRTGPADNVQANAPQTAATGPVRPSALAAELAVGGAGLFTAQVGEVSGGAFGYSANVSLFGAAQPPAGPAPSVTLPPAGGNETDSAPSGTVVFGPATLFESGALNVSTEGTTGPDGSVTSSASVLGVGPGPFTAGEVSSTCTATADGVTASTTIANGVLQGTSSGQVNVPASPGRNTSYEGVVEGANDNFRIVFNEQVVEDNSVTVNAVHMYLLGPTAEGELVIGQSRCGLGGAGGTDGTSATGGRSLTGGMSATPGRSGTGGRSGSSGRSLADTGGETPTLFAAALMLAAFTMRHRVRLRPVAGPDGRP
ncbi:MAG TPA: choice-of-anchor P family protein [Acidimicrobiales bacterium]|nr:choice-of-anchor P family protein [Acidimicrobiales bacterium]